MKTERKKSTGIPMAVRKSVSGLMLMALVCGTAVLMGSATFRVQAVSCPTEVTVAERMPAPSLPPVKITPRPIPTPTLTFTEITEFPPAPEAIPEAEYEPEPEAVLEELSEPILEPILASVSLDAETQVAIYDLCEGDDELFCAVMAIAREETGFNPSALGDSGRCVGMMQINRSFHLDRMEKLGVTDLTDPVQCAAVAIDYIRELSVSFGWVDSHPLYLAYNAGPVGAANLNKAGVYSSRYTYEVLRYYNEYMKELNPTETEEGGNHQYGA